MAQVLVRRLDDDVVRRLKAKAAANGRSLEAEARAVLTEAAGPSYAEIAEQAAALRARTARAADGDSVQAVHEGRAELDSKWDRIFPSNR
jgi:plasmid stability protein